MNHEIEKAKNELEKAKQETAATAMGAPSLTRASNSKSFSNAKLLRMAMIGLLLVAIVASVTWVVEYKFGNKGTVVSVEQVKELSTLATAEAKLKYFIDDKDYKLFGIKVPFALPGTKQYMFILVPATVIAGVDLQQLTEKDFKVDEENKKIHLTLPKATFLGKPNLHFEEKKTYSDEGLISGDIEWDKGFDLATKAQDEILIEAEEMGLLATAETNAEKALKAFFKNLGYEVDVEFK